MVTTEDCGAKDVRHLPVLLDRDAFLRKLLRYLTGTLQDVVGVQEVSGLLSIVGQKLGDEINRSYKAALQVERLSRTQVAEVLVDFKQRISGEFSILEQNDERIVLGCQRCPFSDDILGRPTICMMTSNVFGSIAAQNLGYARVVLERTIATGSDGCRVVVHLQPSAPELPAAGREYFEGS
jgi:predicted ArsR family transcriptional regulator